MDLGVLAAFLLLAYVSFHRKSVALKYVTLIAAVAYMGFAKSYLISITNIFSVLEGNLPVFKHNLAWYLFFGFTVVGSNPAGIVGGTAHDRFVEVVLVADVVVEQPARDPGLLGQQVDAQLVERAGREQPHAEVEQLGAALLLAQPGAGGGCAGGHVHQSIDTFSITPVPSCT